MSDEYMTAGEALNKELDLLDETELVTKQYQPLHDALMLAYRQASGGKGRERHARGRDFKDQPIMRISELLQTSDGLRYQAIKKIQESQQMDTGAAIKELLGAINYVAAIVITLQSDLSEEF